MQNKLNSALIFIAALACGAAVANLYYAQTLIANIADYLHLNLKLAGIIVTLTQIGYGLGLLFIVPMADLFENRRLICATLLATSLSLLGLLFSHSTFAVLTFFFLLGLTCVSAQIIIPLMTHLAPEEIRGKTVGNIMIGLTLGILLARPAASWFADLFMWKAVYIFSLMLILPLALVLQKMLPQRQPEKTASYWQILSSLPNIWLRYNTLRRRAIYHFFIFGTFSLFWTAIALLLLGPPFNYSHSQIALFALAGISGILAAPIGGRLADRNYTRLATGLCMAAVALAFIIAYIGRDSVIALIIAALLLDAGVSCNVVLGQRAIYMLAPQERGRINGIYIMVFFLGGALGSALSSYIYANGGWTYICVTGLASAVLIFGYFWTERKDE
jgi:predicted MFS family arabinose efflux permease